MPLPLLATLEVCDGGIRYWIFFATLFPAVVMATRQSSYLVDYYFVVVCLNRFIRRVLDWYGGQYDPRPISSLLPLLIGAMMLVVVACQLPQLAHRYRQAFYLLAAAIAYGMLLGVSNGLGMFYSALEYTAPCAVMFYTIAIRPDFRTTDRWINTLSVLAVAVAAYGWYQWAYMPPWDAAWIGWSGMWTSMGHPEPFETSICSTLESRGPFAWFMATAAIPMLVSPRWRRIVGWPGAILVVAAILPSTVRSAWGILVVGLGCFALLRGGQSWGRVGLSAALAIAALMLLRGQIPETEQLFSRLETVSDLASDRSFQGRTRIAQDGMALVMTQPLGYGLGSSGLAGKVTGRAGVINDNGFLELLATFGIPGVVLFVAGLATLIKHAANAYSIEHAAVAVAMFTSGVSALVISNWFTVSCSGMAMMVVGGVIGAAYATRPYAPGRQYNAAQSWTTS